MPIVAKTFDTFKTIVRDVSLYNGQTLNNTNFHIQSPPIVCRIKLNAYTGSNYSSDVLVPLDSNFTSGDNLMTALQNKGIKIGYGDYAVGPHLAILFDDSTSSTTELAHTGQSRVIEVGISGISTNKALADKIAAGINTQSGWSPPIHSSINYTATASGSGNGTCYIVIANTQITADVGQFQISNEAGLTGFSNGFTITYDSFHNMTSSTKIDIATSRSVDNGVTGTDWCVHRWQTIVDSAGAPGGDHNSISGHIHLEDTLEDGQEVEISGYFFRGQTPLASDLPAGSSHETNGDTACIDVLYENDSSQFANFRTNNNKTRVDYLSPYDGSNQSLNGGEYSKFSYHFGKGIVPAFNGHDLGTRGGWRWSTGESDTGYHIADDGRVFQNYDGRMSTEDLDEIGAGLTRFFKIIIVNRSGSGARLKLRLHSGDDSHDYYGVYNLRAKFYTMSSDYHGVSYEGRHFHAINTTGIAGTDGHSDTELTNMKENTNKHEWTVMRYNQINTSVSRSTENARVDPSASYQLEYISNFRLYSDTGVMALPICGLEAWVTPMSEGIPIGANSLTYDTDKNKTGTHVLGPMPGSGYVKNVYMKTGESIDNLDVKLKLYKINFSAAAVGDVITDYSKLTAIRDNWTRSTPSSGSSTSWSWIGGSGSTQFSKGDCIILFVENDVAMGWVASTVVLQINLSSYD